MPIILDLVNVKIKKTQFTRFGLGNMTEYDTVKDLIAVMLNLAKGLNPNGTPLKANQQPKLVTMSRLTYWIAEFGTKFAKQAAVQFQNEIYNQFVGDFFELFAEYFLKEHSKNGQYGIIDYKPALTNNGDWGVDGYGIAANQQGGNTPAVVQVKFRTNKFDDISYTCLAKTGWDGVKNYGLDVNRPHNVILFSNTENGANHFAQTAFGNSLYVIKKSDLDKDVAGIKTVAFWDDFNQSV